MPGLLIFNKFTLKRITWHGTYGRSNTKM